jgi:hypothetical protein
MAIPAKAYGPQPAVLVLPDGSSDTFALSLTDALALAGFVTCAPKTALSYDEANATLHWLATNAYATGKVAAVGVGAGARLVERVATGEGSLSCGVLFDGAAGDAASVTPLLHLPLPATIDAARYAAAWREALDFLAAHLQPSRKADPDSRAGFQRWPSAGSPSSFAAFILAAVLEPDQMVETLIHGSG